jgi:uncharacterized protein (TIGR03546 family)
MGVALGPCAFAPKGSGYVVKYFLKQIKSAWHAVAGRTEPSQLAWAVAFGVLLGIVPHGNLLAVGLIILVLSLHLNHALATVTAVATVFLATRLDPYSHQVGQFILRHEDFSRHMASAWQLPFVPWTDTNNTVVTGSFVIGVIALTPIFMLTYPIFHLFRSKGTPIDGDKGGAAAALSEERASSSAGRSRLRSNAVADPAQPNPAPPSPNLSPALAPTAIDAAMVGMNATRTGNVQESANPSNSEPQLIETRIDVIRMAKRTEKDKAPAVEAEDISKQDEPMSEALNYLLRQLNDSRDRRAA